MCKAGAFTINNLGTIEKRNTQVEDIVSMIDENLIRLKGNFFSNRIFLEIELYFRLRSRCSKACDTLDDTLRWLTIYRQDHPETLTSSTAEEYEPLNAKKRHDNINQREKQRRRIADGYIEEEGGFFSRLVKFIIVFFRTRLGL